MGSPPTVTFDGGGGAAWHSQTEISPSSQAVDLALEDFDLGLDPLGLADQAIVRTVAERPLRHPCGHAEHRGADSEHGCSVFGSLLQKGGRNGLRHGRIEQSKCKSRAHDGRWAGFLTSTSH
eukprot:scaffold64866_cov65-Phaeocystis_antarctica.AAC.5